MLIENEFQKNYAEGQEYNLRNLCDGCKHNIPECPVTYDDIENKRTKFGNGKGNDNVIECIYFDKR